MSTSAKGLLGLAASAALAVASSANAQSIIYVDDDAPAGGDGASWATAQNSLHAALAAAVSGDEIRVAAGRYAPAGPGGSRSTSFILKAGVSLVGGYAGVVGPDPDERNLALHVTTLSGDLSGNDAPGFVNITDNSYHILQTSGVPGPTTRIDGVHFSGGNATGAPLPVGGGIFINGGSPTIESCVFTANAADSVSGGGAAVCSFAGAPSFINCDFTGNRARYPNNLANGLGGAVFLESGGFEGCTFTGNIAREGGAVYVGTSVTMTGCVFTNNSAHRGGAIYRGGTGVFSAADCRFSLNAATDGGAINFFVPFGNPTLANCTFTGNTATGFGGAITNFYSGMTASRCTFSGNSAVQGGGAVNASSGAGLLLNCTIAGNTTGGVGGGVLLGASNSTVELRNTIVWGNSASSGADEAAQITRFFSTGTFPIVNYSCIMGLTGALGGVGNIGLDPLFADPLNGDYSLSFGSPCIDAGDPDPVYNDAGGSRNDMGAIGVLNAKPDAVAVVQQLTALGQTALVRLDASGSYDPDNDASELVFEWFVDGAPVCDPPSAACAVIDVPMTYGEHTILLRVTDPGSAFDEDVKSISVNPASLALLETTRVSVDFATGEFAVQGEIALPSTLSHTELQSVAGASLDIGGITVVPSAQYAFSVGGHNGDKWSYSGPAVPGVVSSFEIDFGGSRFLYRQPRFPVRLQADTITSTQTILSMDYKARQSGAFTLAIGPGVLVSIDGDGNASANVPFTIDRARKEITLTLPFPIEPSTTFTFSGGITGVVSAADHLTTSVGRYRIAGLFDPALTPDGAATAPCSVEASLDVGAECYAGVADTSDEDVTIRLTTWRFQ